MTGGGPDVRRHRVWPMVAVGIGVMLTGLSIAIALQLSTVRSVQAVQARRVNAPGTVVRAGLSPDHKGLRVRWQDPAGRAHVARFVLVDRDDYWREGTAFTVRYDPEAVDGKVVAGPGYADDVEEGGGGSVGDYVVLGILVGFAVVCALAWPVRGLLTWLTLRAPATTALATPYRCVRARQLSHVVVQLTFPQAPPGGRATWTQRVLWAPAFDDLAPGGAVTVRVSRLRPRRAVIELPGGGHLWPAGGLRRGFLFDRTEHRPPGVSRRPVPGPRAFALLLLLPALLELKVRAHWPDLVVFTAATYGLLAHLWIWTGGVASASER
jgi:hypothetical protein